MYILSAIGEKDMQQGNLLLEKMLGETVCITGLTERLENCIFFNICTLKIVKPLY